MAMSPTISFTASDNAGPMAPARGLSSVSARADDDLEAATQGSITAAFDALLSATQATLTTPRPGGDSISASRMFERGSDDAGAHRLGVLKARHRAEDLSPPRDPRLDGTSVDARRSARGDRDAGLFALREPTGRSALRDGAAFAKAVPTGEKGDGRMGTATPTARDPGVQPDSAKATSGLFDPKARITVPNAGTNLRARPTAEAVAPSSAPPGPASPASDTAQRGSLAQRVARLLSTGRGGETGSPRAVASSSASDGARLDASRMRNAPRGSQGRRAPAHPSAQRSGDTQPGRLFEFDRLVRAIRLQVGGRNSTARLELKPPELGRVRVEVRMKGGRVRIDVRTESTQARDVLYERAVQLRASLEQHGIQVDRLHVTTETAGPETGGDAGSGGHEGADGQRSEDHNTGTPGPTGRAGLEKTGPSDSTNPGPDSTADAETRLDIRI